VQEKFRVVFLIIDITDTNISNGGTSAPEAKNWISKATIIVARGLN